MKRSSESAEPENDRAKATRRQEPVSCQFCRTKKLKCDRLRNPCSNCRARKLPCSLGLDASQSPIAMGIASSGSVVSSSQSIEELNFRVKRLEELFIPGAHPNDNGLLGPKQDFSEGDGELARTVSSMETDNFETVPSLSSRKICSEARSGFTDNFGSFFFSLTKPQLSYALEHNLTAILPSRNQGEALLNYYFENIDWIYRILHVPTVKGVFNDLYTQLEDEQQPAYRHLALISTIFALSAYFCTPPSRLYLDRDDAIIHSKNLILLAQDALTAANCLTEPSIETLQSLIMIAQWLMPNIGAIATLRTLSATLMHTARSLGLHLTDSPANKKWRTQNQVDWVDVEVKRRIWWHITSTDWLLSFMGGVQNGTYMINPKHMAVEYPSNVNDLAITSNGNYAQPDNVPTETSFFRFRCRATTLFREVVDAAWEAGCDTDTLPYETVLEFDKKFNRIIHDFDSIFANTRNVLTIQQAGGLKKATDHTTKIYGSARLWPYRNLAHFCINSRFLRLHRPYLVRGAKDPRYSYSRMVCLRSARSLLELGNTIISSSKDLIALKIWFINHHMYVATVILVMDYCFNRNEPRANERKAEILECFQTLKSNNNADATAVPGLQKLEKTLRDATMGKDNDIKTHTTIWETTKVDPPNDLSQYKKAPSSTQVGVQIEHLTGSVLPVYEPNTSIPRENFTDGISQEPWLDFGANPLETVENIPYDTNLDTSFFDEFFQNLDNNNDLL